MANQKHPQENPDLKSGGAGGTAEIRVWDLPTRLFHWLLVLLILGAIVSVEIGEMAWHGRIGTALLVLITFRILWGFIGGEHARFTSFVRGPRAVMAYLGRLRRREPEPSPGHNPLGGWSVIAFLVVILVQATMGLFANDDILFEGPLAHLVTKEVSDFVSVIHHRFKILIIALIALHLIAVFGYLVVLRKNLIRPMVTGKTQRATATAAQTPQTPQTPRTASLWRALVALSAAGIAVIGLINYLK